MESISVIFVNLIKSSVLSDSADAFECGRLAIGRRRQRLVLRLQEEIVSHALVGVDLTNLKTALSVVDALAQRKERLFDARIFQRLKQVY